MSDISVNHFALANPGELWIWMTRFYSHYSREFHRLPTALDFLSYVETNFPIWNSFIYLEIRNLKFVGRIYVTIPSAHRPSIHHVSWLIIRFIALASGITISNDDQEKHTRFLAYVALLSCHSRYNNMTYDEALYTIMTLSNLQLHYVVHEQGNQPIRQTIDRILVLLTRHACQLNSWKVFVQINVKILLYLFPMTPSSSSFAVLAKPNK